MNRFWFALALILLPTLAAADPIRVATFNAALSRKGPGLLLRDIANSDRQVHNVAQIIRTVRPDILLINELDHDYENKALLAFLKVLTDASDQTDGIEYPYFYAPVQNTGQQSGLDLNGDGKVGGPADAFGFGAFRGQYAMALVSRFPIDVHQARDFAQLLWKDFDGGVKPVKADGTVFPSAAAMDVMRLSSKSHWDVPVTLPDGRRLYLLASHPTPPVFDGPENANGKRNSDEILFWNSYIKSEVHLKSGHFVVLGDLNSDPYDGDGSHQTISDLLAMSELQDVEPASRGGENASAQQGGANLNHIGAPSLDTADWRDEAGPGNLRVDYVLPSRTLKVVGSGVFWPAEGEPGFEWIGSDGRASSDHRLVWVDLE